MPHSILKISEGRVRKISFAGTLAISAIRGYQMIFSPDHGIFRHGFGAVRCKFFPSCSEYAILAIRQYGLLSGCGLSCKRILRCHPWSEGGYDPI